jgi:hypothetical protein
MSAGKFGGQGNPAHKARPVTEAGGGDEPFCGVLFEDPVSGELIGEEGPHRGMESGQS